MKENRAYLVSNGLGNVFALTPDQIDNNNGNDAEFKLVKVDGDDRAYLEEDEPTDEELYESNNDYVKNEGRC